MFPPKCTLTVEDRPARVQGPWWGTGQCPAAPSQKSRARMGMVTSRAQPSSVCPWLHAAGKHNHNFLMLWQPWEHWPLLELDSAQQDPALLRTQKGFMLLLFCNTAAASSSPVYVNCSTPMQHFMSVYEMCKCCPASGLAGFGCRQKQPFTTFTALERRASQK